MCESIRDEEGAVGEIARDMRHIRNTWKSCDFKEIDGVLHVYDALGSTSSNGRPQWRIVLPEVMRKSFIIALHENLCVLKHSVTTRARHMVGGARYTHVHRAIVQLVQL